jgi:hypothetical protein
MKSTDYILDFLHISQRLLQEATLRFIVLRQLSNFRFELPPVLDRFDTPFGLGPDHTTHRHITRFVGPFNYIDKS